MNLLIFEYISGGGYANQNIPSSTLCEAYGMLQSFILDCKAVGHNITTLIDSRLKAFNPPKNADKTFSVNSISQIYSRLREISNLVDAVYIIAPESYQILERLLLIVNNFGGKNLNCEINAIIA